MRLSKASALVSPSPFVIDDTNLSRAWARLLLRALDGAGTKVAPLILSLSGFADSARLSKTVPYANLSIFSSNAKAARLSRMWHSRYSRSGCGRCPLGTGLACLASIAGRSGAGRQ